MEKNNKNRRCLEGKLYSDSTVIGQLLTYIQDIQKDGEKIYTENYKKIVDEKKKCNDTPFLSVIIRTQGKREDGLREALLCLQAQKNQNFEVILIGHKVEKQGLDKIEEILDEQTEELRKKVRYISIDKGTRATPINYGFAYARGKYAAIFDDDDLLFDNWVESFYEGYCCAEGQLLHAYTFSQRWKENSEFGEKKGYCAISEPIAQFCQPFNILQQLSVNKCPLMSVAFPLYLFNDYGIIFDETLDVTEDWDYIMKVAPICGVYDIEEPTSIYRLWENVENSATLHNQVTWDKIYQSIREKFNSHPFLLPSGFMNVKNSNNQGSSFYSVGFPRMVGILFMDLGDGFSDDHYIVSENQMPIPQFKICFKVPQEYKNALRFRIDPCEYGGIILRNSKITVRYYDDTESTFKTEICEHNGVSSGKEIYFMHYDPQVIWNNTSAVKEIYFEGYISMEIPESLIQLEIERQCARYSIRARIRRVGSKIYHSLKGR